MQRVTISMDETLATAFDTFSTEQGYQSRSEAVRDLVRLAVGKRRLEVGDGSACVANLSYVFEIKTLGLAARLSEMAADNHSLVVSTVQAPLDHHTLFASTLLKGPSDAVRALAAQLGAERGVRFASLNIISVDPNDHHEGRHDHEHHGSEHLSLHPG